MGVAEDGLLGDRDGSSFHDIFHLKQNNESAKPQPLMQNLMIFTHTPVKLDYVSIFDR